MELDPSQLKLSQRVVENLTVKKNSDGTEDREYVLDMKVRSDNAQIATILSDGSVNIFNGYTYQPLRQINTDLSGIVGILYQSEAPYSLYVVDSNGNFQVWNSNTGELVKAYEFCVPVYSFTVLCEGTLLVLGGEEHILFVNIETGDLVGKYKDVHSEPITQLISHPVYKTVFASGSEDGLICVFDMSRGSQDDSLITVLNVESAVDKIGWWGNNKEMVWCITMTRGIYLYDTRTSEQIQSVVDASTLLQSQNIEIDTVVDLIFPHEVPVVIAGTTNGTIYLIQFNNEIKNLNTLEGHKDMVRCACTVKNNLITGAEDSSICIWSNSYQIQNNSMKQQRSHRLHDNKPYR